MPDRTSAAVEPITGRHVADALAALGITHAVYLPDAVTGTWEGDLHASPVRLVRVCREGEAWPLAFGLRLGGARPLVIMQCTGLFESGDALRNVVFDFGEPLYALVGYRSYLIEGSRDTARRFTEPIVDAWNLDHVLVETAADVAKLVAHYRACQTAGRPGIALVAEGRM